MIDRFGQFHFVFGCDLYLCPFSFPFALSFCTLFADVENPTVNGIYQRLGFEPLGEFEELDFE